MNTLENFESWRKIIEGSNQNIYQPVIDYEKEEKGTEEKDIWKGLEYTFKVMYEAVETGFSEDMTSHSGMINNGAKKVKNSKIHLLSKEFTNLISSALSAKEVNSCMGRVVAAPTAGASGIMPGVLKTLRDIHGIDNKKIYESMLVAAGIGLIIEKNASIAGAVGGCQAETGSAAAMASGAIVYAMDGSFEQIMVAVGITIQCTLGLVCDPVAGLVEVPCVVRNASAAAIAFSSAQMAIAGINPVIPVDECIEAMGEIGQSMETKYKETAQGGLATTKTGLKIAEDVLVSDIDVLEADGSE